MRLRTNSLRQLKLLHQLGVLSKFDASIWIKLSHPTDKIFRLKQRNPIDYLECLDLSSVTGPSFPSINSVVNGVNESITI